MGHAGARRPKCRRFGFLFRLTCTAGLCGGGRADRTGRRCRQDRGTADVRQPVDHRCGALRAVRSRGRRAVALRQRASRPCPIRLPRASGQQILVPQLVIFRGMIAGIGVLLVLPRVLGWIRNAFIDRIARIFAGLSPAALAAALLRPVRSSHWSTCSSSWGTLYLLLQAAGLNVNAWLVAGFIPLLQLVNGLPFLYMGWGGREIAMATHAGGGRQSDDQRNTCGFHRLGRGPDHERRRERRIPDRGLAEGRQGLVRAEHQRRPARITPCTVRHQSAQVA